MQAKGRIFWISIIVAFLSIIALPPISAQQTLIVQYGYLTMQNSQTQGYDTCVIYYNSQCPSLLGTFWPNGPTPATMAQCQNAVGSYINQQTINGQAGGWTLDDLSGTSQTIPCLITQQPYSRFSATFIRPNTPSGSTQTTSIFAGMDNNGDSNPDCWIINNPFSSSSCSPNVPPPSGALTSPWSPIAQRQQECVNAALAWYNTQYGQNGAWSITTWTDTGQASPCSDTTSDMLQLNLQQSITSASSSAPQIRVCASSCGNDFPHEVGGWDDSYPKAGLGPGCIGNGGTQTANTMKVCSNVPQDQSLIKLCASQCGGTHPTQVGEWDDTNQRTDIMYNSGCVSTNAQNTPTNQGSGNQFSKICGQDDVKIRVCASSCGSSRVNVGSWGPVGGITTRGYTTDCVGGYVQLGSPLSIFCQQGTQCSSSTVCPSGQVCQYGACVVPPPCSSTNPCPSGQVCQSGQCVASNICNPSCGPGYSCQGGTCIATLPCTSSAQCASTQTCYNGACVNNWYLPCTTNAQCPAGWFCGTLNAGYCGQLFCSASNPCPSGMSCQNNNCVGGGDPDQNEGSCLSQGFAWNNQLSGQNRCCGDDGTIDAGPSDAQNPDWLCVNQGGTLGTPNPGSTSTSPATFTFPYGVHVLSDGSLTIADTGSQKIRMSTPSGFVTTLAGSTTGFIDGTGSAAKFNDPLKLDSDLAGNLYVADNLNHRIRKVSPQGVVTTIAGSGASFPQGLNGPGSAATFFNPRDLAVDNNAIVNGRPTIFVADQSNELIRKITHNGGTSAIEANNWVVSTFAGNFQANPTSYGNVDAVGSAAKFDGPVAIDVDSFGYLYVADMSGNVIRRISPSAQVTTIAGIYQHGACVGCYVNGLGNVARFGNPWGIGVYQGSSGANPQIYVADSANHRIRSVVFTGGSATPASLNWQVSSIAGTGVSGDQVGPGASSQFNTPRDVSVNGQGEIYVTDTGNHRIKKISPNPNLFTVSNFVGTGSPGSADSQTTTQSGSGYQVSGGQWNWYTRISHSGALIHDDPTAKTYVASSSWSSCPLSSSPYLVNGHDYLCFDPQNPALNLQKRLILRIDDPSCGPYANSVCNQPPYSSYATNDLLHFFDRSPQWVGSYAMTSLGSNAYVIPSGTTTTMNVLAGEVLEFFSSTMASTPGEAGTGTMSFTYDPFGGGPAVQLQLSPADNGLQFTFPYNGVILFPNGPTNLYGAHISVFLNTIPAGGSGLSENEIAECCGTSISNCNSPYSNQLLGGARKQMGNSILVGGVRQYCTPSGRWITDLDTLTNQGDPQGLTCNQATLPSGISAGFAWTGSLCCGDDPLETYNDPGANQGACYLGNVLNHCGQPGGSNNQQLAVNGVLNLCDSSVPCTQRCTFTRLCSIGNGWQQSNPATPYSYSLPPGNTNPSPGACCQDGGCFDGTSCIANQASNPSAPAVNGYHCVNGQWINAVQKYTPFGDQGFCAQQNQCLYSTFPVSANLNNTWTQGVTCVNDGSYVNDNLCYNGAWTSRTSRMLYLLMNQVGSSEDFTAVCDSYDRVLGQFSYLLPSNNPASFVFTSYNQNTPIANNVCVLRTQNLIIFGTTLNIPISQVNTLLEVFGKPDTYCNSLTPGPGAGAYALQKCSNDPFFLYGPGTSMVFVALQNPSGSGNAPPPGFFQAGAAANVLSTISGLLSFGNLIAYPTSFSLDIASKVGRYDRMFLEREGTRAIVAMIENPFYLSDEFVQVHVVGFNSNICNYISKINAAQQTSSFPANYNVVFCNANTAIFTRAVISRDLTNNPVLGYSWDAGSLWPALGGMMRFN